MTLLEYAGGLVGAAGKNLRSGEIFAKVLTTNDDSGRHGVLIPGDAYSFFPDLPHPGSLKNATGEFPAFDYLSKKPTMLAYKYYERFYPERRITRLNVLINDRAYSPGWLYFYVRNIQMAHPVTTSTVRTRHPVEVFPECF